ncbi:hypothetical protein BPNPMPFG_005431 [Mesorhizobium sp. AR07]|uniref:hypothetical protein n=1 Tax=Mesorhizobium sp. AR07 TaxID=2865838 RepID=UPI00215F98D2|nr:hypothetical protein [Mesorhizobium sp. AR07]UVK43622.1 hypothetical protein BPNPMPFG_005431 [Mesorhizobium sp. AR07]
MTPITIKRQVKGFLERKYPGATVIEGPKALTIFETPEDHETAVTITFAQTGSLRRQIKAAVDSKAKPGRQGISHKGNP